MFLWDVLQDILISNLSAYLKKYSIKSDRFVLLFGQKQQPDV